MKNWKQGTFFGIVTILVVILALVACDGGKVPQALYGIWVIEEDETNKFTISKNTVDRVWDSNGEVRSFTVKVTDVKALTNTRTEENVNADYPNGYKLTGTFVSHSNTANIGNQYITYFFLSADKKKFWEGDSDEDEERNSSLPPSNVGIKQ